MQINAEIREKLGKAVKAMRTQGLIPAELYGHGLQNQHLSVNAKEFNKLFRTAGSNTVVDVMVSGKAHKALIHEVAKNYLNEVPEHIDFYEVRMDEVTKAMVPIELVGEAPAVKEQGGILNRSMAEIEVEALPADLPHKFEVDISGLKELNQSIYAKDLKLPKGVKISVDPEAVLATVTPPLKEEEIAPAPAVDLSEVKVETEEKKAERDKEKEAEAAK